MRTPIQNQQPAESNDADTTKSDQQPDPHMAFSLMATTMGMTGEKVTDLVAIYSYPGLRQQNPRRPDQTLITGLGLDQFGPAHATPIQMPREQPGIFSILDEAMKGFMLAQLPTDYRDVPNPQEHKTHPWTGKNLKPADLAKLVGIMQQDPYGPYYVAGWDTGAPKPQMLQIAGVTITNPTGHIKSGGHTWGTMLLLQTMPNDAERWYIIYATPNKRFAHINRTPFDPKLPFVHVLINGDPTAFFAVSATGQILPIRVAAISSVNNRYHSTSLDGQPIGFPRI